MKSFRKEPVKFERARCKAIVIVELPEELFEEVQIFHEGSTTNNVDAGSHQERVKMKKSFILKELWRMPHIANMREPW